MHCSLILALADHRKPEQLRQTCVESDQWHDGVDIFVLIMRFN